MGELGTLIQQRQNEAKQKFGKLMQFIMQENECSWEEAKSIYKRTKIRTRLPENYKHCSHGRTKVNKSTSISIRKYLKFKTMQHKVLSTGLHAIIEKGGRVHIF